MRRILGMAAAIVFLLSLFGCGAFNNASSQGSGSAETPYTGSLPLTEEPLTLSVFTHTGVASDYPPPSNDLEFWQYLEHLTGVQIEWETAPFENYSEVVSARLSSGATLPDIMNVYFESIATEAGRSGLLIDLKELLSQYGYYTTKWLEKEKFAKALWFGADGDAVYSFQSFVEPTTNQIVLMYNKAWLEEIGEDIPTTTEEFLALCRKMVGVDFNKNGAADEIILTGPSIRLFDSFSSSYGLEMLEGWDAFQAGENGIVTCDYISDNMREYLGYLNTLYQEGILDKNIFNSSYTDLYNKAVHDQLGIVLCYSSFAVTLGNMTPEGIKHPNSEIFQIGLPLKGPYGDRYILRREMNGLDCTGITRDCKNPELAIKWLDTLFAHPDVVETRYWGFEGISYTVNENSKRVRIMPSDGSIWDIKSLGCGQIAMPHIQTLEGLRRPFSDIDWWVEGEERLYKYFRSPSVPHIPFTQEEQEIVNAYRADINYYFREMQIQFITGQKSLDEWDDYLTAMKALHIDELTSVYQSIYDRTRDQSF